MTIREAQNIIDHWINTTGVRYFNELTNTSILMEEVGEVAPWPLPRQSNGCRPDGCAEKKYGKENKTGCGEAFE
jgi:hypothetical protein